MKITTSVILSFVWLLFFTAMPTATAWACGNKKQSKKVTTETAKHISCCKTACGKNCQKVCCKKKNKAHNATSHNEKDGDCGDDCNCPVSIGHFAVLEHILFDLPALKPVFSKKQPLIFQNSYPKSPFIKFWQPPKL